MRQSNKYIVWGLVKKIRNFHLSRRGKPLKFPRFPVTSVTIHMLLKRGWGNTKGWSMENPSWKICCNPLLYPPLRAWERPKASVVPWLCPQLKTQPTLRGSIPVLTAVIGWASGVGASCAGSGQGKAAIDGSGFAVAIYVKELALLTTCWCN